MQKTYHLSAKTRTEKGRKNWSLRAGDQVPAVVYGAALKEPKNIAVDRNAFTRLFREAGESSLVELEVEGSQPLPVLIQDIQLDPLRNEVIHAAFRAVDMTKAVEADVKLHFTGESVAMKSLGGTLVHPVETLRVKALPKDLPHMIEIDLSRLATFEDAIHLKDIVVGAGVEFLGDKNQTVALVTPPRSEEELAELDKAVEIDVTKVEVAGKKKEEEEAEGEEGAAAGEKKPETEAKSGKAGSGFAGKELVAKEAPKAKK